MGKRYFLFVLPFWAVASGCSLIENGTRNLVVDVVHYPQHLSEWSACHRNDKLADAAWNYIRQINPECEESIHYARGFKQGFADYLKAGGTGAPPPIPPRQYWNTCYQTPRGHQAVEEWYGGFRHGSAMAQDSGFRQWITVPSSLAQPPNMDEAPEEPTLNESALKPTAGALASSKKPRLAWPKKPATPPALLPLSVAPREPAPAAADARVVPAVGLVQPEKSPPAPKAEDKEEPQAPPTDRPVVIIRGVFTSPTEAPSPRGDNAKVGKESNLCPTNPR
jgi:hypothetical protein